jgi:hypothetical protein
MVETKTMIIHEQALAAPKGVMEPPVSLVMDPKVQLPRGAARRVLLVSPLVEGKTWANLLQDPVLRSEGKEQVRDGSELE